MLHPAALSPPCGAFCPGCEICCDLVVDEFDSASRPFPIVEREQKSNGDAQLDPKTTQRRNGNTVRDASSRETSTIAKVAGKEAVAREADELLDKDDTHGFDTRHGRNRACGRQPGNCCRKSTPREWDACPAASACGECCRDCLTHRMRCKVSKLQCAVLCCIGRSACRERSLGPRGREYHCTAKRCGRSRPMRRAWCCWT